MSSTPTVHVHLHAKPTTVITVQAPAPAGTKLPTTGAPIAGDAAIGGGFLVAGLAMCLAGKSRRRRP